MSINEFSVGPFYFAFARSTERWFFPHGVDITELNEPYRRGKALLLPALGVLWCAAVGVWHRDIYDDVLEDFSREGWPKWMRGYEPDEPEDTPGFLRGHTIGTPGRSQTWRGPEMDPVEMFFEDEDFEEEEDPRGVEDS